MASMSWSPPSRVSQVDPESPSRGKRPNEQSYSARATMGSWARRTGFRGTERAASNGSDIEINLSDGTHVAKPSNLALALPPAGRGDLEAGNGGPNNGALVPRGPPGPFNAAKARSAEFDIASRNNSGPLRIEPLRLIKHHDDTVEQLSQEEDDHMVLSKHSHMKYELRENPGLGNHCPFPISSPSSLFHLRHAWPFTPLYHSNWRRMNLLTSCFCGSNFAAIARF